MTQLSPTVAAQIAQEVYSVQDSAQSGNIRLKLFLSRKEFTRDKQLMTAEVGSRLIHTQDGFGLCVAGGKGFEKDVFIIFRGSTTANNMADWVNNLRIGIETSKTGSPVHIGFNSIFKSMLPQLNSFLQSKSKSHFRVHCIGHSLGGAIATLAADWLSAATGFKVCIYTFGAPKSGLEFFASKLTQRVKPQQIHRVFHSTDPVPMIPLYPFTHAPFPGKGHHLFSSEGLLSAEAHDMENYIGSIRNKSWMQLNDPLPQSNHEKLVERWLASDHSVNPFSPKTWDWINAGLGYVLKKVLKGVAVFSQSIFIGGITLADKIAWLLRKGIDLTIDAGNWVLQLMRKIMQALGMVVVKTAQELTYIFMRRILERLLARISAEAQKAVRHIIT